MPKTTPLLATSRGQSSPEDSAPLPAHALPPLVEMYLMIGGIEQQSPRTLAKKGEILHRLAWWLGTREKDACDLGALRAFFHYLTHGHKEPGGRWAGYQAGRGGREPRNRRAVEAPMGPGTVATYHEVLKAFFAWAVREGEVAPSANPMTGIPAPIHRPDQIQPFAEGQVAALLSAAKRSQNPRRDRALLLLMLDTGMRASEVISLTVGDADHKTRQLSVEGKGGKRRTLPFSQPTALALLEYRMKDRGKVPEDTPLFPGDRGARAGLAITRRGLEAIFTRLGAAAKLTGVRCSPHTMRHCFAVSFLRAGGNVFTLQTLMGHQSLSMTQRYVAIAQADVIRQHSQYSPVAHLLKSRR